MSGWLPLFSPGGPSGMRANINSSAYESPFKSLLMDAIQMYVGPSANPLPYITENNLPKNGVLAATYALTIIPPALILPNSTSGANDGTKMVVYWEGVASGTPAMGFGASCSIASGGDPFGLVVGNPFFGLSLSNNGGHTSGGRVEFYFDTISYADGVNFAFAATSTFTNLANVIICRASDEVSLLAAITSGDKIGYFTDEYRNRYKTTGINPWRPMGLTNPNDGNNVTQHRYRTPWATGTAFCTGKWHPNCIAGDNGSGAGVITGTNAYSAAGAIDTPVTPSSGEMIQGYVSNANTGSGPFTFSRDGSTPLPIRSIYGDLVVEGEIQIGLSTWFLDPLMGAWIYSRDPMKTNVPYELQIAFANDIQADYWCNFPPHVDDNSVTEIVTLVRTDLDPSLNAHFEWGNELWNYGPFYPSTFYYNNLGQVLGIPTDNNRPLFAMYGLRLAQIFPLVKDAWSPRSLTQLKRMMVFQSVNAFSDAVKTYRMFGADLDTSLGYTLYNSRVGQNYHTKPDRPMDQCEDISYGTYCSGGQVMQFDANYIEDFDNGFNFNALFAAADDYDSADPTRMASALAWVDNDVRSGARSNGVKTGLETVEQWRVDRHPAWSTVCDEINADRPSGMRASKIYHYEGGPGFEAPSTGTCTHLGVSTGYSAKVAALYRAYKLSDLFYDTTLLLLNDCKLFSNIASPSLFVLPGISQWGLLADPTNDIYGTSVFKSWDAMVYFNHH